MCFAAAHLQARSILAKDQQILSPQPLTSDTWEHYADGTRCRLHRSFLACLAPGGNPARLFQGQPHKSNVNTAELTTAAQGSPHAAAYVDIVLECATYGVRTRSNPRQLPHCHAQPQQGDEPAPAVARQQQEPPHAASRLLLTATARFADQAGTATAESSD
jgi:hypothetical protein